MLKKKKIVKSELKRQEKSIKIVFFVTSNFWGLIRI